MDEELDQIEKKNDTWELVPDQRIRMWSTQNGLSWMKMDRLQGTKLDWYVKNMHRLKESTLKRHLPQFLEWKQSNFF